LGDFEDRLIQWNQLRENNNDNTLDQALYNINNWWQMLPIDSHYLHWEDTRNWPNPWDLLADGIFCGLAKSLGIVYTLQLINRADINDITLVQTNEGDNLVLVNQGLYILNWSPTEILNNDTLQIEITRTMDPSVVTQALT